MKEEEIKHVGRVVLSAGSSVVVRIEQSSSCSSCPSSAMCMAADKKIKDIEAIALEPLREGDTVEVVGTHAMQTKAVLLAYVLPFVILVAVMVSLSYVLESEALVGTLAILSLVPYLIVLRLFSGRIKKNLVFHAKKA